MMCRTEMCRFGVGNWIFLLACIHLFTYSQGGEDASDTMFNLTTEPADVVVVEGESAMLSCGAAAPARLSWRYSASAPPTRDHSLPRADSFRKQLTNGSLLIERMSPPLAGQYQCVATVDGIGTVVSRVATVFLAEVPEFLEGPRTMSGVLGSPALLPCSLKLPLRVAVRVIAAVTERRVYGPNKIHAPPPVLKLNVTWLKNGSPVQVEAARLYSTVSGALEIDPLRTHDAATYRCAVSLAHTNKPPVLGPEIDLRVNSELAGMESAPRILTTPQPVTVIEGASVTFDCAATGNPKPEIVWLNNGVAIDLNDLDSRFYLVGGGSLRVVSSRAPDAGAYTCRATNRIDAADHSAHLHVLSPPRVSVRDGSVVRAVTRGDVTLRCDARGRPPPVVTWLKDGEPLTPNNHDIMVDGTSLRIRGVLDVDEGVFQCVAASAAGSAAAALRLIVAPHADPLPTNLTPTFLTPDLYPEDVDFIGETSSAFTPEPLYDDLDNVDYSEDLDSYDAGKGNASVVSAPGDFRAVIVKHRFVTLSWTEPKHALEEVTGYIILYKVKGSDRERLWSGEARRREAVLASLAPRTTYTARALALTRSAASPPTETIEVTTPDEELSYGPPQNVSVEAVGAHSLRVWWAPPAPLGPHVPPEVPPAAPGRYVIYYTETESGREQSQYTNSTSITLSGLRAATAYRVRVSAGGGGTSDVTTATRADAPSAPPTDVTVIPATDTSLLVRWSAPAGRSHRGALTGYKLRYRTPGARRADSLTTPADTTRADLTGLEPSTTYQVRVCALNANGSGPFSEWVSATTQPRRRPESSVPAAPPPLTTRAGRDWISVWWGSEEGSNTPGGGGPGAGVAGGGAPVRGYWLGWGLGVPDSHSRELPAHAHSHVIRDLESNSEYVISLRASNTLGLGPAVYATVRTKPDDGEDEPDEPDQPEDDAPPLIPPVGLKVIMLSGTTAVVYWTDPTLPKGQTAADGRRYAVRWSGGGRSRVYNASDLNLMLDDLKPYTHYEFAVKLIKGGRESPWSMLASNTSLEAAPGSAPRELRVSPAAPASRAADLTWSPPAKPNGVITGYVIMYGVSRGSGAAEEWSALAAPGERGRARVDRLRARTTYSFKIQARNSRGLGPFSPAVTYTTGIESGEGAGLASATSAWLWASAGGACAVLALAAALALSLCCRRNTPPMSPDTSTYQKASASAGIKPPDLWIHHDQMELKHMDKSLHSSAISAGSVEGSALVSSTLTLSRTPHPHSHPHPHPALPALPAPHLAEYEPARHPPPITSLDRRYVPTYVDRRSSSGSADTAPLRASPLDYRCDLLAMTGVGVGVGVGCTGTCERRRHLADQSTPLLTGVAPLGSPQSSLTSHPPAPCVSGQCPLGTCSAPGSEVYASASTARERGHYVAYEPLGHYTHRDSVSTDAAAPAGTGAGGSLQRRGACSALHSFTLPDNASDHSTPSHSKGSARASSPYKASASSSPAHTHTHSLAHTHAHALNRLQLGGGVSHSSDELEPLTPSRSSERLHREMQNLEGLMKDLSAITQNQFHC
ncbi:neogenin isoform X2 [Danaus plexippus]|uniref:neogenin isoform X2 n=1 Tax=Danaus plexippus TaxID=13037 RepID=UPI002AB2D569|nr:neogenin isoform X2 [Danaus plexippus]